MGACIGRKSSKYSKRDQSQSDHIQTPPPPPPSLPSQPIVQDKILATNIYPILSEEVLATDGSPVNIEDDCRISKIDDSSINSELQLIIDEQEEINQLLSRIFQVRVVSGTDTELECELAKLMNENPENNNMESPSLIATDKSNDAR